MMFKKGNKALGSRGEDIAVKYLMGRNYRILCRNYKTPAGEADIVAMDNGAVVFIEVKARSNDSFGQPFEAVDYRKQEKLKRVALYYLKHRRVELPVRFDVISIITRNGKNEINHIVEAF